MNRLEKIFRDKKGPLLNVYCTAGFPRLDDTLKVLQSLAAHGADMIELGMPYSDPLADGPVIQQSSMQALQNGMSIPVLFEQLKNMRQIIPKTTPVILMGYLNPILQYGFEKFCTDCKAVGVDALIIPDIPPAVYQREYRKSIQDHQLNFIFLVTPETPDERVKELDALSSGFLYAVSSSSLTGSAQDFSKTDAYLQRLASLGLKNPVLVGFGIRDRQSFLQASQHTAGAIIGSAYIQALQASPDDIGAVTHDFLNSVLQKGAQTSGS